MCKMVVTEFLLIFNYTVQCSLCSMPGKVKQTLYLFVLGCEGNLSAPAKFVVANHVLKIVVQGNFANLFLLQIIADICCCKFCILSFQINFAYCRSGHFSGRQGLRVATWSRLFRWLGWSRLSGWKKCSKK